MFYCVFSLLKRSIFYSELSLVHDGFGCFIFYLKKKKVKYISIFKKQFPKTLGTLVCGKQQSNRSKLTIFCGKLIHIRVLQAAEQCALLGEQAATPGDKKSSQCASAKNCSSLNCPLSLAPAANQSYRLHYTALEQNNHVHSLKVVF